MGPALGGTFDEPLEIDIFEGEVVIIGPGPIGVAMTASAAAQTARRLAEAANQALRVCPRSQVPREA